MAEIIGTFASIATIASLAGPTARLLRTMRKIAKDSDHVAKDIDIIASQVEMASVGLDIALRQLEGHCLTMQHIRETPSDVTNYIVKHNLTEAIVRGSKGIKRHMKDVKLELNSLNRNSRVIKGLKWYLWAKMEVESLLPQFQLVISCLSLVCPILSLEICIHHSRTLGEKFASQFQPEIESLKDQLRMSEHKYQRMVASEAYGDRFQASSHGVFQKSVAPLLRLSGSMRTSETTPEKPSSSSMPNITISPPSGSGVSSNIRYSRFSESPSTVGSTSSRSSSSLSTPSLPSTPPLPSTPSTPSTPSIPSTYSTYSTASTVSIPATPPTPSDPVKVVRLRRFDKAVRLQTTRAPEKPESSTIREHLDTSSIPPTPVRPEPLLKLKNVQLNQQATPGHLKNPQTGHFSKTLVAMIDSRKPYNTMSIKTAREINMDIVELNSDDRKYLARSDGEGFRRVVGKVLDVEWQFERWTRSVRLNFWVEDSYQSQGYDLVLGNDYIDVKYEQDR